MKGWENNRKEVFVFSVVMFRKGKWVSFMGVLSLGLELDSSVDYRRLGSFLGIELRIWGFL